MLLSATMALPGMTAYAQDAGVRSESVALDYNHAEYKESDNRMQVEVDQFSITVPIASSYELKINAVRDVVSGASPVLYLTGDDADTPVMVKQAGASIKDTRDVLEVSAGYYGANNYLAAKIGQSKEDDYEAKFGGIDYIHYFNSKNTNLLLAYAQSNDEVWNVHFPEGSASFDPFLDPIVVRDRKQQDVMLGVDQILDRNIHLQVSLTLVDLSGDLSDPYKKVYIEDEDGFNIPLRYQSFGGTPEALESYILNDFIPNAPFGLTLSESLRNAMGVYKDSRPNSRQQNILLFRYSRYFEFADAGLHLDYRYADDDWGATSATIEVKWSQALPWGVIVTPGFRYYSQDSADFYKPVFTTKPSNNTYSSDYRLAGFGSYSYKLTVDKTFFDQLSLRLSYEYCDRQYDLAWSSSSEGTAVDDYNYDLISLSLGYRF